MRKTILLTMTLLKNGSGNTVMGRSKSGRLSKQSILLIVLAVAFTPLALSFGAMVSYLYDMLAPIQQEGVVLGLGLSLVSLAIFLFGIFYVINVFYFAQDIEALLPLPLTPAQVLTAKFNITLLYEYVTELIILAPILVAYGVKSGAGIVYYVYSAIIFLTLPIIPLVIGSVFAMIIMRITNIGKNKDRSRMIGGVAVIVLAVGFNIVFQRMNAGEMDESLLKQMLLSGNNSFVQLVTKMFPSVQFGANALLNSTVWAGLGQLLLFLLLSALLFAVFAALGHWIYFKGVMGMSESAARRKLVSGEQLSRMTMQQSALKAYTWKEIRLLLRTPAYFLNCVLISFLWPVIILIPIFTQPEVMDMLRRAGSYAAQGETAGLVLAAACSLFLFVSGSNHTSATSISREGTGIVVNKFLPIPYGTIIFAKVLSGWIMTLVSVLLLIITAVVIMQLSTTLAVMLAAMGLLVTLFSNLVGMMFDLNFPKLHWDNEQKAVKQNLNGLYLTIICLLSAGLIFFAALRLTPTLPFAFFSLVVLFALLDGVLYAVLMNRGPKWLNRIEG